jgi:hypothetical protein
MKYVKPKPTEFLKKIDKLIIKILHTGCQDCRPHSLWEDVTSHSQLSSMNVASGKPQNFKVSLQDSIQLNFQLDKLNGIHWQIYAGAHGN